MFGLQVIQRKDNKYVDANLTKAKILILDEQFREAKVIFNILFKFVFQPKSFNQCFGSGSGNVDLDPGTKKNRDKLTYKSTKIIKYNFFKKKSLILFNIRE